ncbi:MAG: carotenoid 1,2-hydratase [Pseudomonadota bacterium]
MTERGSRAVDRGAHHFAVGPSAMRWDQGSLCIEVAETSVPRLTPLRGRIRLTPEAITADEVLLDAPGGHVWRPFAPHARIEVEFERPAWRWRGDGYFDANFGARAMERDFSYWTWTRARLGEGAAALYDVTRRDGSALSVALRFRPDGRVLQEAPPPPAAMPRSLWRVRQATRADAEAQPRRIQRMEDVPFYVRSGIRTRLFGEEADGVYEALDLDRFASPWVKLLLPFRMPRRAG